MQDLAFELPDGNSQNIRQRSNSVNFDLTNISPNKQNQICKPNGKKLRTRTRSSFLDINLFRMGIYGYFNLLIIAGVALSAYWITTLKGQEQLQDTIKRVDKNTVEQAENSQVINEQIFQKMEESKIQREAVKNQLEYIYNMLAEQRLEIQKISEAQRAMMINTNSQFENSALKREKMEEKLTSIDDGVKDLKDILGENIVVVGKSKLMTGK